MTVATARHRLTRLPGGVRVVTVPLRERAAVTVSLMVGVGSRNETDPEAGLAHFIEHMVFKGSRDYPTARAISETLETIGGSSNAATDRESTVFWAKVPSQHAGLAVDVLVDMLRNPLLDEGEIVKERSVVVEELRMYLDNPQDYVHTIFDEVMWPDHPIGRDIAGSAETVMSFDRAAVSRHLQRYYRPDQLVIAVAGAIDEDQVTEAIAARVDGWRATEEAPPPAQAVAPTSGEPLILLNRRLEQANVVLGARAASYEDADRFAVDIANVILGDGMSSRLFLELREEQGLAYEVYSFTNRLRDTGALCISLGCEPRRAAQAIAAARAELERLAGEPVGDQELAKAKSYAIGRLLIHLDSTGALCNYYGQQELLSGQGMGPEEVVAEIEAVTADDIRRVVGNILEGGLRGAVIGPFRSIERLQQALIPRTA